MAIHRLDANETTSHGAFNRDLPPVLTIEPGDTIRYRTLPASWRLRPLATPGDGPLRATARPGIPTTGHAMIGPVAIRGAEPGMTLAIRIDRLVPGQWGESFSGGWEMIVNHHFGIREPDQELAIVWDLEWDDATATGIGHSDFGVSLPLRPFFGLIGMPPTSPGWHGTNPPRRGGGNLDCAELVAGSTLYLPIELPGALVSVGDGHGLQTDGESGGTAIECPMELGELTFDLLPDQPLPHAWAETPAGTLTFGFAEDLDSAMFQALDGMIALLQQRFGLSLQQALALSSLVVDLRITQIVNGIKGVHALLKPGLLPLSRS